jgi:hypothetical protein
MTAAEGGLCSPRKRGEVEEDEVDDSAASSSGSRSRKDTPSRGVARISFLV